MLNRINKARGSLVWAVLHLALQIFGMPTTRTIKSLLRTILSISKFRMSSSYTPGSKHNQPRVCLPFSGASSCFGTPCPFGFYGPAGEGTSRFQRRSQIQCFNVAICSAYARAIETLKCDACEHDLLVVGADRTP